MYYQLTALFIVSFSILHRTESVLIFNLNSTNKIFCHSCKGKDCEQIVSDQEDVIMCNKHTQLCWAGFVDQQPYRTCASRYCTPSGISLDSDVRVETCCHTNLCNNIPLSWSFWSKWYQKPSTHRPETSPVLPTIKPTTQKPSKTSQIYIVNQIVNGDRKVSDVDNSKEDGNSVVYRSRVNASDPASFGINWERIPYKDLGDRVASISKLLVLIMPVVLVLMF